MKFISYFWVTETVETIQKVVKVQYGEFVKALIQGGSVSEFDTVHKNTPFRSQKWAPSKAQEQTKTAKIYITCMSPARSDKEIYQHSLFMKIDPSHHH